MNQVVMLSPHCIHAEDAISTRLPEALQPLVPVAYNLWWSWQPGGGDPFWEIDPGRWENSARNPVKLLRDCPAPRLAAAASDRGLVERCRALGRALEDELSTPFAPDGGAMPDHPVAYFCAEYGLHRSLPIYSGGLGVLAGDLLKEASDLRFPMVGVGLLYRNGFFHQRLDRSGWQTESWRAVNTEELPLHLEVDRAGNPLQVAVTLRGHPVAARIWHVEVGRIPLFLLDTDVPGNDPIDRWITSTLYVGDRSFRVMQYAVLAIGGLRALAALNIKPSTVHLNEGHAALAALELAHEQVRAGLPLAQARAAARERVVFTTHTPVEAGNERYDARELLPLLGDLLGELGMNEAEFLALGRGDPNDGAQPFGVSELALRSSRRANAVSRRHGEVARQMWQHLWPGVPAEQVPIGHVTNGVHLPTWMAPELQTLLDRHLPGSWRSGDRAAWEAVEAIPDAALWAVRSSLRKQMVDYVRDKSRADRLARGEPIPYVEGAARTFDPGVLTLGFARRVAGYKRLQLLIREPARALALLRGPRRLQMVIAGKAHPSDESAKRLVQQIFTLKGEPDASTHVAFLEDYDIGVARALVAGCDVWINVPRAPFEASGTSGMKAALNGGLNLSVLDGWWCEGFDGRNGWAIPAAAGGDDAGQDAHDADLLYGLLEREVIPSFYDRGPDGVPTAWVARIRASLRTAGTTFTSRRMLSEYIERVYRVPPPERRSP